MVYLYHPDPDVNKFIQPVAKISLGVGDLRPSAKFGWRVAPLGDLNGDGYDDVAVVAPNNAMTGSEIYILYGNPDPRTEINELQRIRKDAAPISYPWDGTYLSRYATCIQGAQLGDSAGMSLMGAGDINGDGFPDLVIGAPFYSDGPRINTGRVYVIFGHADMIGRNSRYISRDYNTGIANNGPIKLADLNWNLTQPTGNNNPDALVGGYIPNPSSMTNPSNEQFGSAVLNGIDINGAAFMVTENINGTVVTKNVQLSSLLISARNYNSGRGIVYVYGKKVNQDGSWQLEVKNSVAGEYPGDQFGYSLANLGDISADNNLGNNPNALIGQDFVVGAPGSNGSDQADPKYDVGAAYVYLSQPKNADDYGVTLAMKTYGQNAGDQFGYTVANVGNLDNNIYGNNAIAVGAPYYNVKNADGSTIARAGRVYIFPAGIRNYGTDLNPNYHAAVSSYPLFVAQGDADKQFFGAAIDCLGDINGDDVPEYLIGAPGYSSSEAGNIGRVEIYLNPDTTPPDIPDPMTYVNAGLNQPLPGNRGVK
jgi:hypothetical protein